MSLGASLAVQGKVVQKPLTTGGRVYSIIVSCETGVVAQLEERHNGIVEVVGSSPIGSTSFSHRRDGRHRCSWRNCYIATILLRLMLGFRDLPRGTKSMSIRAAHAGLTKQYDNRLRCCFRFSPWVFRPLARGWRYCRWERVRRRRMDFGSGSFSRCPPDGRQGFSPNSN